MIEYFLARGLDPLRFSAQAYSQYRPIASNATPQGRSLNRRVDLVILRASPAGLAKLLQQVTGQGQKGGG